MAVTQSWQTIALLLPGRMLLAAAVLGTVPVEKSPIIKLDRLASEKV
jgi:hypothetical protein